MVSENLVRWTLRFSVVYNLFGAATFAFPAVLGTTAGLPVAAPLLHEWFVASNILMFSFIAGWLSWRNPIDKPLLVVFGISKITFFLVMLASWLAGEIKLAGVLLAGVDLAMGYIFLAGSRRAR